MVALEFTPKVIRAIEFQPESKPVLVTRALSIERPAGEPSAVARALKEALHSAGIVAKRALVAYAGPQIEHRIYPIPPVFGESRDALLRGKVAAEVATPVGELRISGEIVGKVTEGGTERAEAMTVFTPEFEIRRLTFLLLEAGLSPARVGTIPLALAALHPKKEEATLIGFIHAEPGHCTISVSASGGKLRFAREFPLEVRKAPEPVPSASAAQMPEYGNITLPTGGGGDAAPAISFEEHAADRLVTELTRSLLYFRQLSRGGAVTKLFWSGDPPSAEAVAMIATRLKLQIATHPAMANLEARVPLPGTPESFAVPIGLALSGQFAEQVNLLPEAYIRKRKRRGLVFASTAASVIFAVAAVASFSALHLAERQYQAVIDQTDFEGSRSPTSQVDFLRWMETKKRATEAEALDVSLRSPFTRWKAMFAWIGSSSPAEVSFSTLSVTLGKDGYRGELRAVVRGKDPADAQANLNRFLSSARAKVGERGLFYAPVEVKPVAAEQGKGVVQEFALTFLLGKEG